ncbi:MAG: methylated-DNA--[protein]-cysteine S-methyltransferase [Vampirovibrio sp.]
MFMMNKGVLSMQKHPENRGESLETLWGVCHWQLSPLGLCRVQIEEASSPAKQGECSQAPTLEEGLEGFYDLWREPFRYWLAHRDLPCPLPLDLAGTPFQKSVWRAIQDIPYGQTLTYTTLAQQIQKPRAVRAVAQACAKNPLALVVPCHRVLGRQGQLSGFRWGLALKAKLLQEERAVFLPLKDGKN